MKPRTTEYFAENNTHEVMDLSEFLKTNFRKKKADMSGMFLVFALDIAPSGDTVAVRYSGNAEHLREIQKNIRKIPCEWMTTEEFSAADFKNSGIRRIRLLDMKNGRSTGKYPVAEEFVGNAKALNVKRSKTKSLRVATWNRFGDFKRDRIR